jgi:hypothetical protein
MKQTASRRHEQDCKEALDGEGADLVCLKDAIRLQRQRLRDNAKKRGQVIF